MSGPAVDVLIPTCNRPDALAVTLTALGAQTAGPLRIVVSDQSDGEEACARPQVKAVLRYLAARGFIVDTLRHLPRRGMAEQRAFLLAQARAPYCLFLDDDVILEPDLVERLHRAIVAERCGFVGSALHGLSYRGQARPAQEGIEFWDGPVEPETVRPHDAAWTRHHLHSAANLFHVQTRLGLTRENERRYRVAWIGGCVLFDTARLRACGGFDFWRELPPAHCGEDVLAQLRVMERYGGCGLIPSGAYHMELATTVTTREFDAPMVLLKAGGRAAAFDGPAVPQATGADGTTASSGQTGDAKNPLRPLGAVGKAAGGPETDESDVRANLAAAGAPGMVGAPATGKTGRGPAAACADRQAPGVAGPSGWNVEAAS